MKALHVFFGAAVAAALSACAVEAAPLAAAPAPAQSFAAAAPAPQVVVGEAEVWCDIRITRTGAGLRFTPVAEATYPVDASYRFTLTRIDANGSSDVEQGGDVSLSPYQRATLSSNELSIERGGRYRARLVLEDRHGLLCRQEARS